MRNEGIFFTAMVEESTIDHTSVSNCNVGALDNVDSYIEKDVDEEQQVQKKRSIFFDLPFWEYNLLRNNLDVMHLEKNICDNVLGTLLSIDGKTKDNEKARKDLMKMCLRHDPHLIE